MWNKVSSYRLPVLWKPSLMLSFLRFSILHSITLVLKRVIREFVSQYNFGYKTRRTGHHQQEQQSWISQFCTTFLIANIGSHNKGLSQYSIKLCYTVLAIGSSLPCAIITYHLPLFQGPSTHPFKLHSNPPHHRHNHAGKRVVIFEHCHRAICYNGPCNSGTYFSLITYFDSPLELSNRDPNFNLKYQAFLLTFSSSVW